MIVFLFIILFTVILGFIYLGVSLSETIKESENKILFWLLYFVSALTLFLVVVCVFLFAKYRKKVGPIGPRGFMGKQGEQGDPGNCGEKNDKGIDCKQKTFMLLIQKTFRDSLQRELKDEENTVIYKFVFDNESNQHLNLDQTTYTDLNVFNNKLLTKIEMIKESNTNDAISQVDIVSKVLGEMKNNLGENIYINVATS